MPEYYTEPNPTNPNLNNPGNITHPPTIQKSSNLKTAFPEFTTQKPEINHFNSNCLKIHLLTSNFTKLNSIIAEHQFHMEEDKKEKNFPYFLLYLIIGAHQ